MSDLDEQINQNERETLIQRAKIMGISHSNNISTETLRERIEAKLNSTESDKPSEDEVAVKTVSTSKKSLRKEIRDEAMKLVRLRITNLDPKKSQLKGEILTVANDYIGTVRKFVPFGEATEGGYHVPNCIYQFMKDRKFLQIRTETNRQTGQITVKHNWVREFALEVLPNLTPAELAELKKVQMAKDNTEY